jgi:hypothetical protein
VKLKDPNPLDVLSKRRVAYCPPHFETTNVNKSYNLENAISEWIIENLKGRFYIGNNVDLDKSNNVKSVYTIGFENASEMSYFMLACPHLKY